MDKHVPALVIFDKAETLLLVKPFYLTFCQSPSLLSDFFQRWTSSMAEIKKATRNSLRQAVCGYSFKLQLSDTQLSFAPRTMNLSIYNRLECIDPTSHDLHITEYFQNQAFFRHN